MEFFITAFMAIILLIGCLLWFFVWMEETEAGRVYYEKSRWKKWLDKLAEHMWY